MIRLRHEGTEEQLPAGGFANLRELIDHWGDEPDAFDRLIVGVRVDDRLLGEEELKRLEDVSLDGGRAIEIESRSRRGLALENLSGCAEQCRGIRAAIAEVVDQLRIGRVVEANEVLADLAESFGVLADALALIALALGEADPELFRLSERLVPWLRELIEAQAAGDWVRVADCLEFEIAPLLEAWQAQLDSAAPGVGPQRDVTPSREVTDARI